MKLLSLTALILLLQCHFASAQCNNELTNGDASAGLTGWTFSTGTGNSWTIQNNTYGSAFVSSYNWCTMNQTVDLYNAGYSAQYLDQEPPISYFQMFRGHASNWSDKFYYKVEILNASNQVMDSYSLGSQSNPIITSTAWDTIQGTFTNYGTGLRYVKVTCAGDDAEFWAGYYGAVVDNSIVSVAQMINVGICSGTYTFNNQVLSQTGVYTANFTGTYGCDSTVLLNLHVGPYNINDTFDLCEGDTFIYNSQPYMTTSTITGSFSSINGCDSNISYQVNFHDQYDDTIHAGICPGDFYEFGNVLLSTPGTYTDYFTSAYGCDSNVVLELSVNPSEYTTPTAYFCEGESYEFGGNQLTQPGTYLHTFSNVFGCDSLVNLTLLEDQSYDTTMTIDLCDGDTIDLAGQIITASGTYNETFSTANGGCDSTVTLEVDLIELHLGINVGETSLNSKESGAGASYQWIDCNDDDEPIAGATGKSYTPTSGGKYAVVVTKGPCSDTSNCTKFSPLGVSEASQEGWSVYPIPARDLLIISFDRGHEATGMEMLDVNGKLVKQFMPQSNATFQELDISELPSGIYTLSVLRGESVEYIRVPVQ